MESGDIADREQAYHRAMIDGEAPGDLANSADGGAELYFFDTKV